MVIENTAFEISRNGLHCSFNKELKFKNLSKNLELLLSQNVALVGGGLVVSIGLFLFCFVLFLYSGVCSDVRLSLKYVIIFQKRKCLFSSAYISF